MVSVEAVLYSAPHMKLNRFCVFALCVVTLSGCATQPATDLGPGVDASYHTFLAEVALQRENYQEAAESYAKAAQASSDPGIAQRATQVAYSLERSDLAYSTAERWLALDPDSIDARRFLANLAVKKGKLEQALDYLQEAIDLDPQGDSESAFLPLTTLLMREDDADAATQAMAKLVRKHNDNARAHFSVALLALQSGDRELALSSAKKAWQLAPEWPRAEVIYARALIANGDVDQGLEMAKAVVDRTGDLAIALEYGGLLVDTGRNEQAREQLNWILEQDKDSSGARFALGLLELREDNLSESEKHFTTLLASGRRTFDAVYYLAVIAENQENYTRALPLYARIRSGTYATAAQIRVARMLFKLNQTEAALTHLQRRREAFPDEDVPISEAEGQLLSEMGENGQALESYEKAIKRNPDARSLRFARSFLLERINRVDEAIVALSALLEEEPDDPIALNALGYTLADRTDEFDRAFKLISRALEQVPNDAAIIDSMGWVHYRLGNYDQALEYLNRAYELTGDPEVAAHLGEVLWVVGKTDDAKVIWEGALGEDPDHEKLRATIDRFMP